MRLLSYFFIVCGLWITPLVHAAPYNSVVVFGDSLSDNGNLFAASSAFGVPTPPPPYFEGRLSNGFVAVEYLAKNLGVPLFDFAWGGATTGAGINGDGGNVGQQALFPGMTTVYDQVKFILPAPVLSDGLFVVWGGPNDLLAPAAADVGNPIAIIERAVSNLLNIITDLQARGAKSILAPGMPDLGLTPFFTAQGLVESAQATAFTDAFNAKLQAKLPAEVHFFDTAGLMRDVVANQTLYGFSNISGACYDGFSPNACANPNDYLFFDALHPSTKAHELIAQGFLQELPVPDSLPLIALGCLAWCSVLLKARFGSFQKWKC
jgi:phospholipase/lecithinase/hemolysin